jgi:hypothetical protein
MSKIKLQSYGYSTPVRRGTNNITGNKVGGNLSGGECRIVRMHSLDIKGNRVLNLQYTGVPTNLFQKDIAIFAIGGYFLSDEDLDLKIRITTEEGIYEKSFSIKKDTYQKLGLDTQIESINFDEEKVIQITLEFTSLSIAKIQYSNLGFGFITKDLFEEEYLFKHFYNSKKDICVPEQYYLTQEIVIEGSVVGDIILLKSCNRCQRFLPINHTNERVQLAFSNHCSAKAPCRHGNFSNYQIKENVLSDKEFEEFISKSEFTLKGDFVMSYYGHQLECKACKKFLVNAPLNPLRTSTQHREDSLRRRSFELLIRDLMSLEWVYHTFREENKKEFDASIWEKFNKSCFNCGIEIQSPNDMNLDHTMPLVYLYPLDATATCLCPTCNSVKSDSFPIDFYTHEKLVALAEITGISLETLQLRTSNEIVIKKLKEKIVWFFDEFLVFPEYQKVRDGKTAANSILHSLQKIVSKSSMPFNLLEEYEKSKKS